MSNRDLVHAEFETWNLKDLDGWLGLYTDAPRMIAPGGLVLDGLDGARTFWHGFQDAFPDNRVLLHRLIEGADATAVEATFEGTHTGVLEGADGTRTEATGSHVSVPFASVYRCEHDRISGHRLYYDQLELLGQLGVMNAPA
ncbi:ester cyclase [Actinomycetospora chiangmaiensis]|uniref:ester cyclase n=1 Tax=Actinomycetospora chiangmaiensis TaxID=402650 RepID=UPI000363AACC|nr:ester cyclase [Actinomycetospora chiangmaiensis]